MKGGTLFSGIGAPEISAPGIDWRWSADIDDFANAVRAHHWPEVPNLGDVAAISDPEPVDLIVFGSPCQSFSVAGKRLGLDDPRGNLALVALALVARVRPTWIVFENVCGLFSSFSGSEQEESAVREGEVGGQRDGYEDRDFAAFLARLRECGYLGCWRVLDAQYAGVPQRRRRVFFVGYLGDWRPPAAVLFEPESLRWNPPPSREAGQRPAPTLAARTRGGGGLGTDLDCDGGLVGFDLAQITSATNRTNAAPGLPASTLSAHSNMHVAHSLRGEGFDASEDGTGRGTPLVPVWSVTQDSCPVTPEEQSPALKIGTGFDMGQPPAVAFTCKDSGADAGEVSPTLRSMGHDGSWASGGGQVAVAQGITIHGTDKTATAVSFTDIAGSLRTKPPGSIENSSTTAVLSGPMVRRLTPTECERLQGFSDGFTDIPWRGGMAPDGRRYKALGNSMAAPVIGWILSRIRAFEHLRRAA